MPRDRLKPLSLYGVHPLDAMAAMLRVPPPKTAKPAKKRRAGKRKGRAARENRPSGNNAR